MTKKPYIYKQKKIHPSGIMFDSVLESKFYDFLLSNGIDATNIQVHKTMRIPGTTLTYTPDFVITHNGHTFYVDTKSPRTITKVFTYKKNVLQQLSDITIDIVLLSDFNLYMEYMNQRDMIGFYIWKKKKSKRSS